MARIVQESDLKDVHIIGEGAFGTVSRAVFYSDRFPKTVAIKKLTNFNFMNQLDFEKEYNYLVMLQSGSACNGIIELVGKVCYPESTRPKMIILKYYEGGCIDKFVRQYSSTSVTTKRDVVLALLSDVQRGLVLLHTHNVLHMDIKPENMLVTHQIGHRPRAVLSDFGLATPLHPQGFNTTNFCGTPMYMAPEVEMGFYEISEDNRYDLKADVYSFGKASKDVWKSAFRLFAPSQLRPKWIDHCMSLDPWDRPDLASLVIQHKCRSGAWCMKGTTCLFQHDVVSPPEVPIKAQEVVSLPEIPIKVREVVSLLEVSIKAQEVVASPRVPIRAAVPVVHGL